MTPYDRYLKIEIKAWVGLEQTALSMDAKSHIEAVCAFLEPLIKQHPNLGFIKYKIVIILIRHHAH